MESMSCKHTVQAFDFDDPDAFSRAHDIRNSEYVRLEKMSFHAQLVHFDLGSFRIRTAHFTQTALSPDLFKVTAVMHAGYKSDRATIAMPTGELTDARINGREVAVGDIMMFAPGASLQNIVRGRHQNWAALDFPAGYLDKILSDWRLSTLPRATHRLLRHPLAGHTAPLASALEAAARLARLMPDAMATQGCIAGIRHGIEDLLLRTLTSHIERGPSPSRHTLDITRVVKGADEFLQANMSRPIYTEEICTALAVSPRKMHDAFISNYGVSPHKYLKCRRLALVRTALQKGRDSGLLVKSVALSHGFWHLGHFAQDYFAMFGEAPSRTLQTTTRS
jgi:AraC-like DNA-binding protein